MRMLEQSQHVPVNILWKWTCRWLDEFIMVECRFCCRKLKLKPPLIDKIYAFLKKYGKR